MPELGGGAVTGHWRRGTATATFPPSTQPHTPNTTSAFYQSMSDGFLSLQVDLANLYIRTGAKNMPAVFLLTDAHVLDESFLVLINDLLASGD